MVVPPARGPPPSSPRVAVCNGGGQCAFLAALAESASFPGRWEHLVAGAILGAMEFPRRSRSGQCESNRLLCGGRTAGTPVSARAASADLSVRVVGDSSSLRYRMTQQSATPRLQSAGACFRNAKRRIFCQCFHDDGREREAKKSALSAGAVLGARIVKEEDSGRERECAYIVRRRPDAPMSQKGGSATSTMISRVGRALRL